MRRADERRVFLYSEKKIKKVLRPCTRARFIISHRDLAFGVVGVVGDAEPAQPVLELI